MMTNVLLDTIDRIKPGDCIVCFSKRDIYTVSRQLEKRKVEVAVIYGTLPAGGYFYQPFFTTSPFFMLS